MKLSLLNSCALFGAIAFCLLLFAALPANADITTEKWAKPLRLSQQSVSGYYDPSKVRIAILPFAAPGKRRELGNILMNKLITEVSREGILTVVTRDALDKVLTEQRFQQSGFAEPETAREIGKLLGADLLALGNLSALTAETASRQDDVVDYYKEIQKSKKVWNKEKGEYETKYYTEKEPVYKKVWVHDQWAICDLDVRLIDVETGKVVYADGVKERWTNVNFDNKGRTYPQPEMEDIVLSSAMTKLARKVTPYRETFESYIMCYPADFMGKTAAAKTYEDGWRLALTGDYQSALENMTEAYKPGEYKETRVRVILWNVIAISAALGKFDDCDRQIAEYLTIYDAHLEASEKKKAAELKGYLGRNFERMFGASFPSAGGSLQVAAIEGGEYFLSGAVPEWAKPGVRLRLLRASKLVNQITGEELGVRERQVGVLEIVETAENYIVAKLISGEAQLGDMAGEYSG